jgi:predicted DNA-binding transcriptional regulator YafY
LRRADRLFQIIQLLRRHRVATARSLAEELEVSERTVYRDISDLVLSGVPIEGEAGVGYVLRRGFDLPPLMFTDSEVEALVLGMRVVASWADADLAHAAEAALGRVEAALPDRLRLRLTESRLFAPGFHVRPPMLARMGEIRPAIEARRKVWLHYRDVNEAETERLVRPLGLFFWGYTWSLTAWCELRADFRSFRLDRIVEFRILEDAFQDEPGRTLEDYFAALQAEHERHHNGNT